MTLFILGIFTGIGIAILWGNYLNNQRKKELAKETEMQYKHFAAWLRGPDESQSDNQLPLLRQLQNAVDREDFKEAARLRDLINRK